MPTNKRESLIFTIIMCFCMVLFMSLYGALEAFTHVGDPAMILPTWIASIPWNFVAALPWNLLVAGPLSRWVFRRTFHEGTVLAEPVCA